MTPRRKINEILQGFVALGEMSAEAADETSIALGSEGYADDLLSRLSVARVGKVLGEVIAEAN